MEAVHFIIKGRPVGKGRPRFTKSGHCWTPSKTVMYEQGIKQAYWMKYGPKMYASDKALAVEIVLYYPRPKSMTKKNQLLAQQGLVRPIVKPDVDNVTKAILDALNGIAFDDDRQIVQVTCEKWYDTTEENEGFAVVTIKGWEAEHGESGMGSF